MDTEPTPPPSNIFVGTRSNKILTTDNPLLFNLQEFPPVKGLPEGRVKVRCRANETAPIVFVLGKDYLRAFLLTVDEKSNELLRGPEIAANYRFDNQPAPQPAAHQEGITEAAEAAALAQANADATGHWWSWYVAEDGSHTVERPKILNNVSLNDNVLEGKMVVVSKPSIKHGPVNLVYPSGYSGWLENSQPID